MGIAIKDYLYQNIMNVYNFIFLFLIWIFIIILIFLIFSIIYYKEKTRNIELKIFNYFFKYLNKIVKKKKFKYFSDSKRIKEYTKYIDLNLKSTHNLPLEIVWTFIPIIVILELIFPSLSLIAEDQLNKNNELNSVNVIGNQWYWNYEINVGYIKKQIDSNLIILEKNNTSHVTLTRLLATTEAVIIPVGIKTSFYITSNDVIHSWSIPGLGVKVDAIPGRLNSKTIITTRLGLYSGMCSELCGIDHGFMPISLKSVTYSNYIYLLDINKHIIKKSLQWSADSTDQNFYKVTESKKLYKFWFSDKLTVKQLEINNKYYRLYNFKLNILKSIITLLGEDNYNLMLTDLDYFFTAIKKIVFIKNNFNNEYNLFLNKYNTVRNPEYINNFNKLEISLFDNVQVPICYDFLSKWFFLNDNEGVNLLELCLKSDKVTLLTKHLLDINNLAEDANLSEKYFIEKKYLSDIKFYLSKFYWTWLNQNFYIKYFDLRKFLFNIKIEDTVWSSSFELYKHVPNTSLTLLNNMDIEFFMIKYNKILFVYLNKFLNLINEHNKNLFILEKKYINIINAKISKNIFIKNILLNKVNLFYLKNTINFTFFVKKDINLDLLKNSNNFYLNKFKLLYFEDNINELAIDKLLKNFYWQEFFNNLEIELNKEKEIFNYNYSLIERELCEKELKILKEIRLRNNTEVTWETWLIHQKNWSKGYDRIKEIRIQIDKKYADACALRGAVTILNSLRSYFDKYTILVIYNKLFNVDIKHSCIIKNELFDKNLLNKLFNKDAYYLNYLNYFKKIEKLKDIKYIKKNLTLEEEFYNKIGDKNRSIFIRRNPAEFDFLEEISETNYIIIKDGIKNYIKLLKSQNFYNANLYKLFQYVSKYNCIEENKALIKDICKIKMNKNIILYTLDDIINDSIFKNDISYISKIFKFNKMWYKCTRIEIEPEYSKMIIQSNLLELNNFLLNYLILIKK